MEIPRYFFLTWSYWFGEFKSNGTIARLGAVAPPVPASNVTVTFTPTNDNDDLPSSQAKNNSSGSLQSGEVTHEQETAPLVISPKNQPYLDYGASGTPALRIENLSKVSGPVIRKYHSFKVENCPV